MLPDNVRAEAGKILATRREIVVAYLYGSSVGSAQYDDIDIGLLLDEEFSPSALYEAELAAELERRLGGKFDVRVLNGRPVRFLFEVIKTGVVLYSSDENRRVEFEVRVMMEYYDMKYYFDRYDEMRRQRYVTRDHRVED